MNFIAKKNRFPPFFLVMSLYLKFSVDLFDCFIVGELKNRTIFFSKEMKMNERKYQIMKITIFNFCLNCLFGIFPIELVMQTIIYWQEKPNCITKFKFERDLWNKVQLLCKFKRNGKKYMQKLNMNFLKLDCYSSILSDNVIWK